MRKPRNYLLFVLVLILVAFAFKTVEAQNGGGDYSPGKIVLTGKFLEYYLSVPEHDFLFGNPVSTELEMNGKRVQYFDRARFELSETDIDPQVKLAALGYFVYDETKTTPIDVAFSPSPTCRLFPKTGYRVCYAFLQFYDEHNGPMYFGDPVSNMVSENGQLVQYFEYARFEYRFNMPVDMKVGLTNIGRLAMKNYYGTAPMPHYIGLATLPTATTIQARAFVSRALVAPGAPNTLYAVVQLQDFTGVENAKVNVTVVTSGKTTRLPAAETDADGIARIDIPAFDLAPRQTVELQVVVNYEEQTVKTSTWFRIWY